MVPLRGVGAVAKGLPARKWLWMPAPVRSGRRHPPPSHGSGSFQPTVLARGAVDWHRGSRAVGRRAVTSRRPTLCRHRGASSGSRGDGGDRLADGEPIDRSARHAGRGCGRGFSWRPPPRCPREASTGSTARFGGASPRRCRVRSASRVRRRSVKQVRAVTVALASGSAVTTARVRNGAVRARLRGSRGFRVQKGDRRGNGGRIADSKSFSMNDLWAFDS